MKQTFVWLLLSFLPFGYAVSPVLAKERARVRDLTLRIDRESVGVSFFVENLISPKIEKTIQNGVPASFTAHLKLHRSRRIWRDKQLGSLKVTRRIHYDNIKKEYQVFLEEANSPLVFKYFWEARDRLARVENLIVIPEEPLSERRTFYVSVRAELEPEGLPFRLKSLLFFVSRGSTKTDWLVQKFRIGSFVLPKQRGGAR